MRKTFWDRISLFYDFIHIYNKKAVSAMIDDIHMLTPRGSLVLEAAAGTGAVSLAEASKARKVLCSDLSVSMLKRAYKKAKKAGLDNIAFRRRNIRFLFEPDDKFDIVIAANVIHLLDNPIPAIKELWRVTGSGGILILPTFLLGKVSFIVRLFLKFHDSRSSSPMHRFTLLDYMALFVSSGLPDPEIKIIKGRIPIAFAVFRKP